MHATFYQKETFVPSRRMLVLINCIQMAGWLSIPYEGHIQVSISRGIAQFRRAYARKRQSLEISFLNINWIL